MSKYYNIHTHSSEKDFSIKNVFLQEIKNPENLDKQISAGIHPWHISDVNIELELLKLKELCERDKLLAIGEIGLDFLIKEPLDFQKNVFIEQIKVAKEFNLPIIIHCVKAFNELISIKKDDKNNLYWIIHGFNNNAQIAKELINHNCFISFGAALLKNDSNAQKVIPQIPLENLFLETDESDLDIEIIYKKAANLLNLPVEKLCLYIEENYDKCFKKGI